MSATPTMIKCRFLGSQMRKVASSFRDLPVTQPRCSAHSGRSGNGLIIVVCLRLTPFEHFFFLKCLLLTWRAYANHAEWLSLRKRLRGDTFAIQVITRTTRHTWPTQRCTQYVSIHLLKHTNYADYAKKITTLTSRDYARLRPAGPRLREHSCSFTAIIALSCRKKNHTQIRGRSRAPFTIEGWDDVQGSDVYRNSLHFPSNVLLLAEAASCSFGLISAGCAARCGACLTESQAQ